MKWSTMACSTARDGFSPDLWRCERGWISFKCTIYYNFCQWIFIIVKSCLYFCFSQILRHLLTEWTQQALNLCFSNDNLLFPKKGWSVVYYYSIEIRVSCLVLTRLLGKSVFSLCMRVSTARINLTVVGSPASVTALFGFNIAVNLFRDCCNS